MSTPSRRALTDPERFDWLRLIRSERVGPINFRLLLERFGSAAAALAGLPELARRGGKTVRLASESTVEAEIRATARLGARFVMQGEPDYPLALENTDGAPPVLAVHGNTSALHRPMVAIVGARNASAHGLKLAAGIARDLGEQGYVVVSGLARGIDKAAHDATLRSGTVAVVAGGLGRIYPPQHLPLVAQIAEQGCIITEMPFDWTATARDFPRRNRIVSGLCLGTVVIEAAMRSGSLITARLAAEQGREVFAIPGSPGDPRNEGANQLIRQGATLTRHAGDVIEGLTPLLATAGATPRPLPLQASFELAAPAAKMPVPRDEAEPGNSDHDRIRSLLGSAPTAVDDLIRLSGIEARKVQLVLLELDLAGELERHGNNLVSLL